jgi:hypothetical protein
LLPEGPILLVARSILTSERKGPSQGTLAQLPQLAFDENNFENNIVGFPLFFEGFIRAVVPKINSVDSFDARIVSLAM